jgi:DNA modification methylase
MLRSDLLDDLDYPRADRSTTHVIRQSDARNLPIADDSIDLVFTSPPYWQKRDYGHEDQIGQEPTVEDYVSNLMDAFDEWERVLTARGTVFLNIGDKYERKDRKGIPWRVAEAARKRGWTVRSEIIWHKPNGIPNPARDRFTNRHEHIFHFTPRNGYYFDKFGYKTVYDDPIDVWKISHDRNEDHLAPFPEELVERALVAGCPPAVCTECGKPRERKVEKAMTQLNEDRPQARRAMKKFEQSELTEEHVKAIRAVGISDAGKGQEVQNGSGRNTEEMVELADEAKKVLGGYFREFTFPVKTTAGWSRCDCEADTRPGVVLDPFAGSGTTVEVAESMRMSGVGVDLDPSSDLRFYSESEYVDSTVANQPD